MPGVRLLVDNVMRCVDIAARHKQKLRIGLTYDVAIIKLAHAGLAVSSNWLCIYCPVWAPGL